MTSHVMTEKVLQFVDTMKRLVPRAKEPAFTASDWAPLAEFVAVDQFRRVGTFLEVQNWEEYTEMLTQWASSVEKFETAVRRVSEFPGLLYLEVEERHFRGDTVDVVNSMTVFEFDGDGKIRHLNVYLQQPR
jgi:hypothetical protein